MSKIKLSKILCELATGRQTIPILNQVIVYAGRAYVTDLDIEISTPCELPDAMYYVEGFDIGKAFKSKQPIIDFPRIGMMGEKAGTVVLNRLQMEALSYVARAMSTEETRYYLNGICFDRDYCVATDGHRLHSFKPGVQWLHDHKRVAIMPRIAINKILQAFNEQKPETVTITIHESKFIADIGSIEIRGKLIDGDYPNWEKVVPPLSEDAQTNFNPADFANLIPLFRVLNRIHGKGRAYSIQMPVENGEIFRKVTEIEGMTEVRFPCAMKLKEVVSFNAIYLSQLLKGTAHPTKGDKYGPYRIEADLNGIPTTSAIMPMRYEE